MIHLTGSILLALILMSIIMETIMILQFLHEEVAGRGISLFRLETGFSQFDAIQLYKRSGYHRIAPFHDYELDPLSLFFEKQI